MKHLEKAEGNIGRNVSITMKMKTIVCVIRNLQKKYFEVVHLRGGVVLAVNKLIKEKTQNSFHLTGSLI